MVLIKFDLHLIYKKEREHPNLSPVQRCIDVVNPLSAHHEEIPVYKNFTTFTPQISDCNEKVFICRLVQ